MVGDGVTMDTSVMSLQGRGHVILGRFEKNCPGSPELCKNDFSVSFWMKYGGRIGCKIWYTVLSLGLRLTWVTCPVRTDPSI